MLRAQAKVLYNRKIKGRYFKLNINAPRIAKQSLPGQFVHIRINDSAQPLLRRPFSIHRVSHKVATSPRHKVIKPERVEILYEVVGKGTEILSQRKAGGYLDVIGPLGNGFTYPTTDNRQLTTILVAGGMGVAPLAFLAERLVHSSKFKVQRKVIVLLGARTKKEILCEKEFKKLGCDVKISTDDGSKGFKGRVTESLKHLLSTIDYRPSTIYACGPHPMLKEIAKISQRHNIPSQVSLEAHMACGIGACMGCIVKTKAGYQRVCKEGPVFSVQEVVW